MSVFKCKMCGGDLEVTEGMKVIECEYCGTTQTVPNSDSEKKTNLFNRANRLRIANEFDRAAGVYENIISEFSQEAEAYWGLCLCKFVIEYVDDPRTAEKIPTCHRTAFESIFDDSNFKTAIELSDPVAKKVYNSEARIIDTLQQNILTIVNREKPFDVFICYKETDSKGDRTMDSVLAQDIYDALTAKGLKVFFARITLEDKLGQEYEPYIFAALNSAKIMLAIGTAEEYYNAVWVKNEWSRFLSLMKTDKSKVLIPCYKDIDAYDMPAEFRNLQAQDMGKLGFVQDLTRGVCKILGVEEKKAVITETIVKEKVIRETVSPAEAFIKRAQIFLEDRKWGLVNEYCEKALDVDAECAIAYLYKLCIELKVNSVEKLSDCNDNFENRDNFKKAVRFADDSLKNKVENLLKQQKERIAEEKRKEEEERREREEREAKERKEREAKRRELFPGKLEESIFRNRQQHISAGACHTVGLKSDGTVMAVGDNENGACNVGSWKNIVAVSADLFYTVGLKSDGTVVATGRNGNGQCNVKNWKDIVEVSISGWHTVGLKSDGTVVAVGSGSDGECDVEDWKDIIAVSAGYEHTVGLKSDGTVVAVGYNELGYCDQCNVENWKDIIAVSAGSSHTVGLKSDGTVVAVGDNSHGQCDVDWSGWKNIAVPLNKEEYKAKLESARKAKIESLEKEKAALEEELPTIKGLFSGGKKAKVEARIAEIEKELQTLK